MSDIQRKVDEILADIPAFRAEVYAAVRKEHPDITQEALDASWEQAAELFGLHDVDATPTSPNELKEWAAKRAK